MRPDLMSDEMKPFLEAAMAGVFEDIVDFDDFLDLSEASRAEAFRRHAAWKVGEVMAAAPDRQAVAAEILATGWPELREAALAWLGAHSKGE